MTKYWPLSVVTHSPLMPQVYVHELLNLYKTMNLSPLAFSACGHVTRETQPVEAHGLVIVESVNAPARQAYTEYPNWDEWMRLERGGVIEADDGSLHFIIDALH